MTSSVNQSQVKILSYLAPEVAVLSVGHVSSCLDIAWQLNKEGKFPPFTSVLALSQAAGRGRHGRKWSSPPGHLYAAIRLPISPPYDGTLAPLALALVIAFSLETICPKLTVNIKWPNDLMVDGQKVGGLLLENRSGVLVGGIGLNIGGTPFLDSPRDPKVPPAGYLPASMGPPEKLWLSVAKKILKDYNNSFGLVDPNWTLTLIARAERRLMYLHKPVTVTGLSSTPPIPQTEISGRLTGLDPSGALLLDTDLGSLKIWSGSLSPGS